MFIYLIRHGETEWNKIGRIMGHKPIPLNEKGIKEAESVARVLSNLQKVPIYSSDLTRAKQTAEIISKRTNSSICFSDTLREKAGGNFEGEMWKKEYEEMTFEELEGMVEVSAGPMPPEAIGSFVDVYIQSYSPNDFILQAKRSEDGKYIIGIYLDKESSPGGSKK